MRAEGSVVPGLRPGWVAYVDVDWLSTGIGGDQPAILADPDGTLYWRSPTARPVKSPDDADPDLVAGRALAWTAERAVSALRLVSGSAEIVGSGALASGVKELLARQNGIDAKRGGPPAAIVVTEGTTEALLAATRSVADLGVVVLALETAEPVALDLYPDVHARGVTLKGVPGPFEGASDDSRPHPLESFYAELLVRIPPGEPVRRDARWFRISAEPR